MLRAKIKQFTDQDLRDTKGLVDGGHTIFKCSNCERGLIDIFHTQPHAIDPLTDKPFEWRIQALCCFCGDKSYIKKVYGKFHLAGYGKIKPDDPTQDIPETFPTTTEVKKNPDGEILVIGTVKA